MNTFLDFFDLMVEVRYREAAFANVRYFWWVSFIMWYNELGKRKTSTIRKGNNSRHSPWPRCHEDSNYPDAFKQSERYIATQAKNSNTQSLVNLPDLCVRV